jgi:hypothetical protein
MDLDKRQAPSGRRRALCGPAVIGILVILGGCGGSGGDSLPSRTASAQLPTVSLSIDRTEPATSTTVEAPQTEPTPTRTPVLGQTATSAETTPPAAPDTSTATPTQPATTQVTQTNQVTETAQITLTAQVTETAQMTETTQVTLTSTGTPTPVSTPVATVTVTPTLPSATTSMASAQPTTTATETSTWPWWLLGAALLGVAVVIALLLAARRRRNSWNAQLMVATGEGVWFARQLIPQLQRDGTRDQVAGAWQVTRDRVFTLEDTLTGLESTAPDDQQAARARVLRDAVRAARTRIDAAAETTTPPVDITTIRYELGEARATLETALANDEPGPRPQGDQ